MAGHSRNRGRGFSAVLYGVIIGAVVTAIVVGFGFLVSISSPSSELTYTSVHYDTAVQPNGDIVVTQNLTVRLGDNEDGNDNHIPWRQLFQRYTLDPNQYDDITDISVTDASGRKLTQIAPMLPPPWNDSDEDEWNDTAAGTWYEDRLTEGGKSVLEVAWNIPVTWSSDATDFTVAMTFKNAVTTSPDGAEFQWEPVGVDNQTPIEHLSAHVTFPEDIEKKDVLAWLHYENESTTTKNTDGSLDFTAQWVSPGDYVDLRVVTDETAFTTDRHSDQPLRQSVIDEENEKESEWNALQKRWAIVRLLLWSGAAILTLLASLWAILGARSTHKNSQYLGPLDYWRDLPPMSPGAAAHVLNVAEPRKKLNDRVVSATILSLASKKAILLLPGKSQYYAMQLSGTGVADDGSLPVSLPSLLTPLPGAVEEDDKDQTTTIVLLPAALKDDISELHLSRSEKVALTLLRTMSSVAAGRTFFDLEEISEPLEQDRATAQDASDHLKALTSAAEAEFDAQSATTSAWEKTPAPTITLGILGVVEMIVLLVTGQFLLAAVLGFIAIAVGAWAYKWGSTKIFTPKGQEKAGMVVGLRNYLLDFSHFQDRDAQDLTLWDRYLVYAAAFGISHEAIEQLAIAQPQVADPVWLDSTLSNYTLAYLMFRPRGYFAPGTMIPPETLGFGGGFGAMSLGDQLSANVSNIQSTISAATTSSTSGASGGGFSGGGFGGGGGGFGGGSFGGR